MIRFLVKYALITLVVAGGFLLARNLDAGIAAAFGGLAATVYGLVPRWHLLRAERTVKNDVGRNLGLLYRAAIERLVLSLGLLFAGLALFKLPPGPLISAFIVGVVAQMTESLTDRN